MAAPNAIVPVVNKLRRMAKKHLIFIDIHSIDLSIKTICRLNLVILFLENLFDNIHYEIGILVFLR